VSSTTSSLLIQSPMLDDQREILDVSSTSETEVEDHT
jgi:hypothetical protein